MIALLLLTVALSGNQETPSSAEKRGKPFWLDVAPECDIPPWATPAGLVHEALTLLGSTDPEWRDDVGYGVVSVCVYRKQRLGPAERRSLVEPLSLNLRKGIGESGNDSVLLRSFSALTLSIVAAAETREPALDAVVYRRLLDDGLAYLRDERDLRGFEPRVGWIPSSILFALSHAGYGRPTLMTSVFTVSRPMRLRPSAPLGIASGWLFWIQSTTRSPSRGAGRPA